MGSAAPCAVLLALFLSDSTSLLSSRRRYLTEMAAARNRQFCHTTDVPTV